MYVLNAGNNWMLSSYNIDTSNRNRNETTTTIKTKKNQQQNPELDKQSIIPTPPHLTKKNPNIKKKPSLHPLSHEKNRHIHDDEM